MPSLEDIFFEDIREIKAHLTHIREDTAKRNELAAETNAQLQNLNDKVGAMGNDVKENRSDIQKLKQEQAKQQGAQIAVTAVGGTGLIGGLLSLLNSFDKLPWSGGGGG